MFKGPVYSWFESMPGSQSILNVMFTVDPNTTYLVCTGGRLAGPPEDCGGLPGFYDLIEALSDPNHERHEEMLEWIGEFDPQAFSVESVTRLLTPSRRRRDNTSGGWVPPR